MELAEFDAEAAAHLDEMVWRSALVFLLACPGVELVRSGPLWN